MASNKLQRFQTTALDLPAADSDLQADYLVSSGKIINKKVGCM